MVYDTISDHMCHSDFFQNFILNFMWNINFQGDITDKWFHHLLMLPFHGQSDKFVDCAQTAEDICNKQ